MTGVAKNFNFQDATKMIIQVAILRLKKLQTRRGSTQEILNKDWAKLNQLSIKEARNFVSLRPIQSKELDRFDQNVAKIKNFKRVFELKNKKMIDEPSIKRKKVIRDEIDEFNNLPESPSSIEHERKREKNSNEENSNEKYSNKDQDKRNLSANNSNADEEVETNVNVVKKPLSRHINCKCQKVNKTLLSRLS